MLRVLLISQALGHTENERHTHKLMDPSAKKVSNSSVPKADFYHWKSNHNPTTSGLNP